MANDGKELQRVSWEIRLFADLQLHNSFKNNSHKNWRNIHIV